MTGSTKPNSNQAFSAAGSKAARLPLPEPAARAHSERLAARIAAAVEAAGGVLSFEQYMHLALYAPGLGYYVSGHRKFGEGGDFVTAPETSFLFGYCLAAQAAEVLQVLPGGDLLEFGAGSGALALHVLTRLHALNTLPERYLILEPSPELRARQAQTLQALPAGLLNRVEWIDSLPPGFRGCMIANEVLDAMPVRRFRVDGEGVCELGVGLGARGFEERPLPAASAELARAVRALQARGLAVADGYTSEINLQAAAWVSSLAESLAAGLVLLIDYGYGRGEYYRPERDMGTLMCHYRHRAHADPYWFAGLQDITAHVDFSAVAEAGCASGLCLQGYTSQANFLLGVGLERLLAESDPSDVRRHMELVQGAKRLMLPSEMGDKFQVLGLSRGLDRNLAGFSLRDFRVRL